MRDGPIIVNPDGNIPLDYGNWPTEVITGQIDYSSHSFRPLHNAVIATEGEYQSRWQY